MFYGKTYLVISKLDLRDKIIMSCDFRIEQIFVCLFSTSAYFKVSFLENMPLVSVLDHVR